MVLLCACCCSWVPLVQAVGARPYYRMSTTMQQARGTHHTAFNPCLHLAGTPYSAHVPSAPDSHPPPPAPPSQKPATLDAAVERLVGLRLQQERAGLLAAYQGREAALAAHVAQLEAQLLGQPGGKPAAAVAAAAPAKAK